MTLDWRCANIHTEKCKVKLLATRRLSIQMSLLCTLGWRGRRRKREEDGQDQLNGASYHILWLVLQLHRWMFRKWTLSHFLSAVLNPHHPHQYWVWDVQLLLMWSLYRGTQWWLTPTRFKSNRRRATKGRWNIISSSSIQDTRKDRQSQSFGRWRKVIISTLL